MKRRLETPRLILREMEERDAPGLLEMNTDPAVMRYLPFAAPDTLDACVEVIRRVRREYEIYGIGRWSMELKSTGAFIGWTGLKYLTEPMNGHVNYHDLGYRMLQPYWGQGLATESALVAVQYGFEELGLEQIFGVTMTGNQASKRVLEKAGLQQTGTFIRHDIEHHWFETPIPRL